MFGLSISRRIRQARRIPSRCGLPLIPGYNHPDAAGYYPPRIKQPALIRRHIVASGRIIGDSEVSYGELVINNKDGAYDEILEYGYGDTAELRLGDSDKPAL